MANNVEKCPLCRESLQLAGDIYYLESSDHWYHFECMELIIESWESLKNIKKSRTLVDFLQGP